MRKTHPTVEMTVTRTSATSPPHPTHRPVHRQAMTGGSDEEDWAALMRAANRGDEAAYARFLRLVSPVLRRVIRARGGSLGEAQCEDVLQEVLLAVHLKRHTWREDAPIRPWLFALTRHKIVDVFRARGRRVHVPLDDFTETLPAAPETDPTEARDMDRVIDRLEPRAADIVRAVGIRGMSLADTAARHAMSEGAVRVALHRALRRLSELRATMIE